MGLEKQALASNYRTRAAWLALIVLLVALRLPSLVQPAGGDQGLYNYSGQRIFAGDVMYRDVWDQKPPAIAFVYGLLGRLWPFESVVPAADLAVAAGVALLLVALGRRRYSEGIGYGAAAIFLLFGDPYLQRLSGVYVRGQCEPFIGLAVAVALVLVAAPRRRRGHLIGAGIALAAAVWLKYNAVAYALPIVFAMYVWNRGDRDARHAARELTWVAAGFAVVTIVVLVYFSANGALTDLRLATIDYNLQYSNETYESPARLPLYLLTFPIQRARVDMLWFLGGLGAMLAVWRARSSASTLVVLAWLVAALTSIAINGARSLPNYFVQAAPALALAAAVGFATLRMSTMWSRYAVAALLFAAVWRVGSDAPVSGFRFAGVPGLVENLRHDLRYARGVIDRDAYLARFRGVKHDALENERLVRFIREHTAPDEPIYVFGFSGGSVCWKSGRQSASRFFWSRPVLIEFAADRAGYGSAGLLSELQQRPPAIVALQKEEWRSYEFFMKNERLRTWLQSGYVPAHETPMFSVWTRKNASVRASD